MKELLTPEKIKLNFLNRGLNKEKAAELLISLIEGSDNTKTRVNSIKTLEMIGFRTKKIFNTLENYLISDQDAPLRAAAAEYIILNFLEEGITPLNWVIQHDYSPLVLKVFDNFSSEFEKRNYDTISHALQSRNKEFASDLGVVPEESRFFLDLETLFAEDKGNYELDPESYKYYQNLADFKGGEPWLIIKDKHVESLNFNYYKWKFVKDNLDLVNSFSKLIDLDFYINSLKKYSFQYIKISLIPESIGSLIYLKKLILKKNSLEKIPHSIKRLSLLRELDLSYNEIEEIPQTIETLSSLEIFNIKHTKIRRIPDSLQGFLNSLENFYF
ncbi:MAG: leucine-rich repeat domain-containing protein [Promethearchaeota archaeon]|jgi:Leucine-rich repeat (LRR) protein